MGRVYLSGAGILLLLLLTWHYSIQVSAHNTARDQVQQWLQKIGASAEYVDFRMLRGALTINNIKGTYLGGDLHIQQLFIKGNPASIATDTPLLQQVNVRQFSFDAANLSQSWQTANVTIPESLKRIFYYAKNITFQQGHIKNISSLPPLVIQQIRISGSSAAKTVVGQGSLGAADNVWQLHSLFPQSSKKQQGNITALYHNIHAKIDWAGSWLDKNFKLNIHQSDPETHASLDIDVQQESKQWAVNLDAKTWEFNSPYLEATLTGQGQFTGTPQRWVFNSKQLTAENNYLSQSEVFIEHAFAEDIHIALHDKNIHVKQLSLNNMMLNIEAKQSLHFTMPWHINLDNINIKGLEAALYFQTNPIGFPLLHGSAKVKQSNLHFDVSGLNSEQQFVRLKSGKNQVVHVSANHVPLRHLRNLLPSPMQQQALTLEGQATLTLKVKPLENWSTSGQVQVTDVFIASKNQSFKSNTMNFNILKANDQGVQQASLSAEGWLMQFPLTPRQAWSNDSHLDSWAKIPWQLQNIHFSNGRIAIGNEQQAWLKHADLNIQHWQSKRPATLTLQGEFGHAPLQTSIVLNTNPQQMMQWKTFDLSIQGANMFALSNWMQLSGFPPISKGHFDLSVKASQHNKHIKGKAHISLNQLQLMPQPIKNDFLLQKLGQSTQSVVQRLANKHRIAYALVLNDDGEQDLSNLIAQTFIDKTIEKLEHAKSVMKATPTKHKTLGSIRIHQGKSLSHNERSRLRKMIRLAKKRGWHIELTPDLGTAELSPSLKQQIYQTQTLIKYFIGARGIKPQNIYLIAAQNKHHSTSSTGAIHINLVK